MLALALDYMWLSDALRCSEQHCDSYLVKAFWYYLTECVIFPRMLKLRTFSGICVVMKPLRFEFLLAFLFLPSEQVLSKSQLFTTYLNHEFWIRKILLTSMIRGVWDNISSLLPFNKNLWKHTLILTICADLFIFVVVLLLTLCFLHLIFGGVVQRAVEIPPDWSEFIEKLVQLSSKFRCACFTASGTLYRFLFLELDGCGVKSLNRLLSVVLELRCAESCAVDFTWNCKEKPCSYYIF